MSSRGRTVAVVAAAAFLLAACGEETSRPIGADEPTASPTTSSATPSPTPTPTPSPSPSPSATQSPTPTGPIEPQPLTLQGIPTGPPPSIPYLAADADSPSGWSLVEPDGTHRPLPRAYDGFAPMGEGIVGLASVDDRESAFVLDGDLHEVSRHDTRGYALATSPDGAIVAWQGADGTPHVVEQGGAQEWDMAPVPKGGGVSAVVSDGTTCKEGVEGQGCAVYLDSVDGTETWVTISHGITDTLPGVISVGDISADGRLLGMTSIEDEGSCWAMFRGGKRKPLWESCDHTLFAFSPSAHRILAGPAYLDGFGQGFATVLDDQGNELATWETRGGPALMYTAWEDDDHVLAVVHGDDDRLAVLRLSLLDGSVELALPPVAYPPPSDGSSHAPYLLPTT